MGKGGHSGYFVSPPLQVSLFNYVFLASWAFALPYSQYRPLASSVCTVWTCVIIICKMLYQLKSINPPSYSKICSMVNIITTCCLALVANTCRCRWYLEYSLRTTLVFCQSQQHIFSVHSQKVTQRQRWLRWKILCCIRNLWNQHTGWAWGSLMTCWTTLGWGNLHWLNRFLGGKHNSLLNIVESWSLQLVSMSHGLKAQKQTASQLITQ